MKFIWEIRVKSFEANFQEVGDENVVDNVLLKIIAGLAFGNSKEQLFDELSQDMNLIGFSFANDFLKEFLQDKEEVFKAEIDAAKFAHAMLEQRGHPAIILMTVKKKLTMEN